ncbi:MAG: DUF4230 domain-containing protein [Roseburia sp.]|nr:DUF4230 domain-containing protein [Roseburia sp.]MCM1277512.1 DUF4230 domain-containing protein [Robinsoniella sp.]
MDKLDKKKLKRIIKIVSVVVSVIVICIAGIWIKMHFFSGTDSFVEENIIGKEGEVTTLTESTLEKVIKKSQLYTAAYPYNGYATIFDEDGEIKYYVAYEGTVKAGIDVTGITVNMDEDTNTIVIRLPKVQIEEPVVNAGTMEYIFKKEKYNTETVAEEAYRYAIQDLTDKVSKDAELEACATENAKAAERALIEPWVNQIAADKTYTVKIFGYGEVE